MAKPKKKEEDSDDYFMEQLDAFIADKKVATANVNLQNETHKKKKSKAPKKNEGVHEDEEDLDKLLEELDLKVENQEPLEQDQTAAARALKNKLKKEKKKLAKLSKDNDQHVQEPSQQMQTVPKKPMSTAAKLAAERQRKMQELEEQARLEQLEIERLEKEAQLKAEEEERQKQLLIEKKRQQRKEKKERMKQQGKPLTAKEKVAAQMKKKFLEQLGLENLVSTSSNHATDNTKKSKAVAKKPKKNIKQQFNEGGRIEDQDNTENYIMESETDDSSRSASRGGNSASDSDTDIYIEWDKKHEKDIPKQSYKKMCEQEQPVSNGHVDTGKTKLLDKIRHCNVQDLEAGGITQQIGATFFPKQMLIPHCHRLDPEFEVKGPGLLIIDTPGHESFNNLRARGSSLCDIAILVVDIMHGLEPQTVESIELLKARNCYFVIALNKIDRLYNWKSSPGATFRETFSNQVKDTQLEFNERVDGVMLELYRKQLDVALYWENDNVRKKVSIIPTSAITGEGISDLLATILQLVQRLMIKNITYKPEFKCVVLEVKVIDGLGTTIDVILMSGTIREGDTIVICGMSGAIVTTIRTLLTPQPLAELRIKGEYIKHTEIKAAMGVKICCPNLEGAVAGTHVLLVDPNNNDPNTIEQLCQDVMQDMSEIFNTVDRSGVGVYVMASTLGSLEALLQFLKERKIPVFCVNIGTVQKKDVKKASVMSEKNLPEYAVILAFDIKVSAEAEKEAAVLGVRIITADIIYHLSDAFIKYIEETNQQKKQARIADVVFPCELRILPNCVFNKKDPFVFGVKVENGILKPGTPLVAITKTQQLVLGRVASMEHNKKPVDIAVKGQEICAKIVGEPTIAYGRHFDYTNIIYSKITRSSIDLLKEYFRDEMTQDAWKLIVHLKKVFSII